MRPYTMICLVPVLLGSTLSGDHATTPDLWLAQRLACALGKAARATGRGTATQHQHTATRRASA
eukprot:3791329-Prymnesium_polylepis.1